MIKKYVLIGDPDPEHFQRLKDVIEKDFDFQVLRAGTCLEIEKKYRSIAEGLGLVLFTEQLALSDPSVSNLENALQNFSAFQRGVGGSARIGVVYEDEESRSRIAEIDDDFLSFPYPH